MAKQLTIDSLPESLIADLTGIIENADAALIDALQALEPKVQKKLSALLRSLDTDGGKLKGTKANLLRLIKFSKEATTLIATALDGDIVDRYLSSFDKVTELTLRVAASANPDLAAAIQATDLTLEQQTAVDEISARLTAPASISTNIVQPIQKMLMQQIVLGIDYKDAERAILAAMSSAGGTQSTMLRYYSQVTTDALNQWSGTVNGVIKSTYELNAVRYVGSLITDSRPQCKRWIEKGVLKDSELSKEIAWAKANGSGYSKYTPVTPDTFCVYRGGHRCRHHAIPYRAKG